MPGIALGSIVLLHAIRAAALVALVVALVTLIARTGAGNLPSQVSMQGVVYEAKNEEVITECRGRSVATTTRFRS